MTAVHTCALPISLALTVLLRVIWIFNFPDLIFGMTGGGPNDETQIVTTWMITITQQGDYGKASAIGLLVVALLQIGRASCRERVMVAVVAVSSRRRHTRCSHDCSSYVCSSDLARPDRTAAGYLDLQLPRPDLQDDRGRAERRDPDRHHLDDHDHPAGRLRQGLGHRPARGGAAPDRKSVV